MSNILRTSDYDAWSTDVVDRPGDWGAGHIHFVRRKSGGENVLRIFMDEGSDDAGEVSGEPVRMDYDILDNTLSDADARYLIGQVFFIRFTDDYYRTKIARLDIGPLADGERVIIDYPAKADVGDTYAFPLGDGRFGVCRIINALSRMGEKMQKHYGRETLQVAVAHTTFDRLPTLNELDPSSNLYIDNLVSQSTNRDPKKKICTFYVRDAPPDGLQHLGNISPIELEEQIPALIFNTWDKLVPVVKER